MAFPTRKHGTALIICALVISTIFISWPKLPKVSSVFEHQDTYRIPSPVASRKHDRFEHLDPCSPKFYNIISEEEALSFNACKDPKSAASPSKSKLHLAGGTSYILDDAITVVVFIFNDYGSRKYVGGDHLRATITNPKIKAYAPCEVTDNDNGTYNVTCLILWTGEATISVIIVYPREAITGLYRIRTQILGTRDICAQYVNGNYTEEAVCNPDHARLLQMSGHKKICNLTYYNSGMPFYCGKPTNVHLICEDWEMVKTCMPYPNLPLSDCETDLISKRGPKQIEGTISLKIEQTTQSIQLEPPPTIPCAHSNFSFLWTSRKSTGFFYKDSWQLRHCKGISSVQQLSCLKSKHLYFLGDSTVRQWYLRIMERFNCSATSENWDTDKWHKLAECENQQINLKAGWYPHSQPFYVSFAKYDPVRYIQYSIARRIDDIPREEKAIVLIHLYMHAIALHHSVYTTRMKIIRMSVERYLKESPHSKVLIKAPHTFRDTPSGNTRLSDYFGYIYSKILFEVFEGLHDKVVLLNNRDATIALNIQPNHPPDMVVDAMVNQMLSYSCPQDSS